MKADIHLGILGLGVVGSGTVQMLLENRAMIEEKVGARLHIKRIGVRDMAKPRAVQVDRGLLTTNPSEILDDPEIDIVCELIGGVNPAKEFVLRALRNGKQVVTANKELIAKEGEELMQLAAEKSLDFKMEGSVGGGIPIIQPLKNALAGNRVEAVMGIVNGTTNYILSQMAQEGQDFNTALLQAQEKGYAEADPTSDVGGHDAAYKVTILANLAFNTRVDETTVHREGITAVQQHDIQVARELGYTIKLLAIAKEDRDGRIQARVHPTLIPNAHPLAAVSGVYNAVFVHGDFVGDIMVYGQGAGSRPTGSAVVGDIIDVCRNLRFGSTGRVRALHLAPREVTPIDEIESKYYLRLIAQDRPKVLGSIANVFGNCGVSIEAVLQRPLSRGRSEISWITHRALESNFRRAVKHIQLISVVELIANWLRVEEEDL